MDKATFFGIYLSVSKFETRVKTDNGVKKVFGLVQSGVIFYESDKYQVSGVKSFDECQLILRTMEDLTDKEKEESENLFGFSKISWADFKNQGITLKMVIEKGFTLNKDCADYLRSIGVLCDEVPAEWWIRKEN